MMNHGAEEVGILLFITGRNQPETETSVNLISPGLSSRNDRANGGIIHVSRPKALPITLLRRREDAPQTVIQQYNSSPAAGKYRFHLTTTPVSTKVGFIHFYNPAWIFAQNKTSPRHCLTHLTIYQRSTYRITFPRNSSFRKTASKHHSELLNPVPGLRS